MKKKISFILLIAALLSGVWYAGQVQSQQAYEQASAESEALEREASDSSKAERVRAERRQAETTLPKGVEIPHYETSRGGQLIVHVGFALSYDSDFKTPQWVAWQLTAAEVEGGEPRASKFLPDPDVRGAQAYTSDYTRSGYDRGHMAPAADMKWSAQAMKESFYLTNVCPQNRNLNRGDWKDLEELTRAWATRYGVVSVAAGPIYDTATPRRIGANKVAVPDAFFKVLLVDYPKAPKAYAFVFKNEAGSRPLTYYQLTVDEVEERTGMDFFSALPDDVENRIEAAKPAL